MDTGGNWLLVAAIILFIIGFIFVCTWVVRENDDEANANNFPTTDTISEVSHDDHVGTMSSAELTTILRVPVVEHNVSLRLKGTKQYFGIVDNSFVLLDHGQDATLYRNNPEYLYPSYHEFPVDEEFNNELDLITFVKYNSSTDHRNWVELIETRLGSAEYLLLIHVTRDRHEVVNLSKEGDLTLNRASDDETRSVFIVENNQRQQMRISTIFNSRAID